MNDIQTAKKRETRKMEKNMLINLQNDQLRVWIRYLVPKSINFPKHKSSSQNNEAHYARLDFFCLLFFN